jgi:uncharacterized membrane protein YbhN (UPF0104 family)
MKSLRTILKLVVSLGVSLFIMGLLWRLLGDESGRPDIWEAFKQTSRFSIVVYAVLALLNAYVRAIRFRVLIAVDRAVRVPGTLHIFFVSMVRNMLVDLLPARSGELFYIVMMNRGYRIPGNLCVSSLTISFVFDLIALVCITLILALWQLLAGDLHGQVLVALIVVAVIAGIISVLLFAGMAPAVILTRKLLGQHAEKKVFVWLLSFLENVNEAIALARRGGLLLQVFLLSMAVRFIKYAALYILFKGVVEASFPILNEATPVQVLFALVGGEAGASLAIPTFMGFGTYEASSAFTLALFGYPAVTGAASMFIVHLWSQCVDYAFGGAAFLLFTFSAPGSRDAARARQPKKLMRLSASAVCVVALGLGLLALQWRSMKKSGSKTAPPQGHATEIPANEDGKRQQVTQGLNGFVVWSSNRGGNHDIYKMSFPDLNIVRLTTHPHVDYYARISPGGGRIVFARSQEPWVSQRNEIPWDVYMLDLNSMKETLVAKYGNVPTWSPDGAGVCFQRNGTIFVEHRLSDGIELTRFSSEQAALPHNTHLQTPVLNAAGNALAATLRKGKRATVIIEKTHAVRKVAGGCQLNWGPKDAYLYYIDKGGHKKNALYRIDPLSLEKTIWLDLPGDYSHEYFPRVSPDGSHLVIGASSEGHEHDQVDYEIFLWQIGSPPSAAARLTFHDGNDCWPDIWLN